MRATVTSLTVLSLLLAAVAAQAQPRTPGAVGVTGAVNPAAQSTPPAAATRTLFLGANVVMRERIRTADQGTVQVVFVDRSTLNVGRNSEVVIDEFVYNPGGGPGTMTATMARGVLRYVGGRISHEGTVTVNTPSATIGIRGGIALISILNNVTTVINLFGNVLMTTDRGSTRIIRPGFAATATSRDAAPGEARQALPQEMAASRAQLDSTAAQGGGAGQRPTDTTAQQNNMGQTQSNVQAQYVQTQQPQGGAQPSGNGGPPPPPGNGTGLGAPVNPGQWAAQNQQGAQSLNQLQQSQMSQLSPPGDLNPPPMPPTIGPESPFPDGVTSLGDFRSVNVPATFNYSQMNVPLSTSGGVVGSYNFTMQVNLGPDLATRGLTASALINVPTGPNWLHLPVINFDLQMTHIAAPDFGGHSNAVIGYGVTTSCNTNIDCSLGVGPRTVGGRLAREVDHTVLVYTPSGTPPPPTPAPNTAVGQDIAIRP